MVPKHIKSLSKEEFKDLMNSVDVILSDCDGVLWRETEAISKSPETVGELKRLGKKFFYITNNNTKTRSEFVDKCVNLGYTATMEDVVCTSFLAGVYLKERSFDKKAYVIGSVGITKELDALGIKHCGTGPDIMEGDELEMLNNFQPDPEVGAVIIGFDKHFSYPKLLKAATYLSNPNIHFIGTNYDTERPSPNSNKFPGTGCFIRTVEVATNRKAVILGKPGQFLISYIMNKFVINPERTLMIGDNCQTDIQLGRECGFKTLLVLSGVTMKSEILDESKSNTGNKELILPDYYADQLSDVLEMLG